MSVEVVQVRLEGVMMSFGGVAVDATRPTLAFPPRSMLCGLIANALGYLHAEAPRLAALQARLAHAARRDHAAAATLVDFQTAALGPEHMQESWTTRGAPEGRGGGKEARLGTHIRHREYIVDGVYTVAVALAPPAADDPDGAAAPSLADVAAALASPARPLFLGRKCCLPAAPLLLRGPFLAGSLLAALEGEPRHWRAPAAPTRLRASWPERDGPRDGARLVPVTGDRDWANGVHVGRAYVFEGTLDPPPADYHPPSSRRRGGAAAGGAW